MTDVGARKQILRSSGRCYNCLRKGHIGRRCRSLSKCQQCKGGHHISICKHHSQSAVPSLVQAADSTKGRLDPHAPSYSPSTSTLCPDQIKTVLLQTALSVVQNPSRPKKLDEL